SDDIIGRDAANDPFPVGWLLLDGRSGLEGVVKPEDLGGGEGIRKDGRVANRADELEVVRLSAAALPRADAGGNRAGVNAGAARDRPLPGRHAVNIKNNVGLGLVADADEVMPFVVRRGGAGRGESVAGFDVADKKAEGMAAAAAVKIKFLVTAAVTLGEDAGVRGNGWAGVDPGGDGELAVAAVGDGNIDGRNADVTLRRGAELRGVLTGVGLRSGRGIVPRPAKRDGSVGSVVGVEKIVGDGAAGFVKAPIAERFEADDVARERRAGRDDGDGDRRAGDRAKSVAQDQRVNAGLRGLRIAECQVRAGVAGNRQAVREPSRRQWRRANGLNGNCAA